MVNALGLKQAEVKAAERAQAEQVGYSLIKIRPLVGGIDGMSGIDALRSEPYFDDKLGVRRWNFWTAEGTLMLEYEGDGAVGYLVDTEKNRAILEHMLKYKQVEVIGEVPPVKSAAAFSAAPQTVEELTAALNKARAAAGLPPIVDGVPAATFTSPSPAQIVNPPVGMAVINAAAENTGDLSAVDDITLDELREEGVKPPEPVKKAPAPKGKGKAAPKSAFIKMEE